MSSEEAAAPPSEESAGMKQFHINEQRRQEIEHARMLKQIAEAAPPIPQGPSAFARQAQALIDFEEQGRQWRNKKFMPDPILQAALERVNQMERDNPMPLKKMRET
eukprot:scaffold128693_cov68-Phaeocystis_antarctica.AAC.6